MKSSILFQSRKTDRRPGPVRVCFVIDRLRRAGTESQLLALIHHLDRSRVEPTLVLLDGDDEESRALEPVACAIERLNLRKLIGPRSFGAASRLLRFWRQNRTEIVQTYFLDSTYFGVSLARLAGIRHVLRVRNNLGYWLTPLHRRIGQATGRACSLTLTNAESGRQALIEAESLPEDRVVVLENGVDTERFADIPPPSFAPGKPHLGAVANLRPVKNLDGLIRAWSIIQHRYPGGKLDIAGEGEQRAELQALIIDRGLQDSVKLRGSIDDIPAFLGGLDIALLPSHSEAMSNALLEYMAAGRGVIASNVGENAAILRDEIDGIIIPPGDDNALAAAMTTMIDAPMTTMTMAISARERVQVGYSRLAMCRRFEAFYERLIRG